MPLPVYLPREARGEGRSRHGATDWRTRGFAGWACSQETLLDGRSLQINRVRCLGLGLILSTGSGKTASLRIGHEWGLSRAIFCEIFGSHGTPRDGCANLQVF